MAALRVGALLCLAIFLERRAKAKAKALAKAEAARSFILPAREARARSAAGPHTARPPGDRLGGRSFGRPACPSAQLRPGKVTAQFASAPLIHTRAQSKRRQKIILERRRRLAGRVGGARGRGESEAGRQAGGQTDFS